MQWKFDPNAYVEQEVVNEEEVTVYEEPEKAYQFDGDSEKRWLAFVRESRDDSGSTCTKMTPDEKITKVIECLVSGTDSKDAYMTREEVGVYLQYANPADSMSKMHQSHFIVLEPLSERREVVDSRGCIREKTFYNPEGVFEAIYFSRQTHRAADFLRRFINAARKRNSVTSVTD